VFQKKTEKIKPSTLKKTKDHLRTNNNSLNLGNQQKKITENRFQTTNNRQQKNKLKQKKPLKQTQP
jgi:hypothetical protein